ncbi:LruC domain-containing protein [Pedobacter sp. SYP-B3415]|uniref:LruC domain-containing protein n=1 Tax=Pedobacter sp. SYP-B3415 TaxID=2496641 RepID=UPI00101CFA58|nr:LruC domain-containing protein [Pedobacter sp. SYP-B3415]
MTINTLHKTALLLLIACSTFYSCKKDNGSEPEPPGTRIPYNFNYLTSQKVNINIRLLTNNSQPITGALLNIIATNDTSKVLLKAVSNDRGEVTGIVDVPSYLDSITIYPKYTGLLSEVKAVVTGKSALNIVIGGPDNLSGDVVIPGTEGAAPVAAFSGKNDMSPAGIFGTDYVYPSPYTSTANAVVNTTEYPFRLGRPRYLLATSDVIDASLLSYINASLPEGQPLTQTHPEYLAGTTQPNVVVTQNNTEVFVTFVSEGAGFNNTLAWYSYPTNNPPTSATGSSLTGAIDRVTMVFPNASAYGSGGGLKPGNKVSLGRFSAGTTVAFVLIQDAWNASSGIETGNTKFYTDSRFNPETTAALRKHSVLLYDAEHEVFVMGFEDINRSAGSDNDFNDLVVYASASPPAAISKTNVPAIDTRVDTDGDGVDDATDEFPNDPARAYTSYYPSATGWATLAFEDNWPNTGDYDVNDLVVNYRYRYVSNAANNVVDLTGTFQPVAAGADYDNGFGIQLPVAPAAVSSVTGQSLLNSYITIAANGVETGQTKAVIIPFDSHRNLLRNADGTPLVNTVLGKARATSSLVNVGVTFTSPVAQSALAVSSLNPFLISNKRRGYEVHLPNYAPTDKANKALLRTGADNSLPTAGRYYLDANNAPWALNFPDAFSYPVETKAISTAYLNFLNWARSGGTLFTDWYINTAAGYRADENIYR